MQYISCLLNKMLDKMKVNYFTDPLQSLCVLLSLQFVQVFQTGKHSLWQKFYSVFRQCPEKRNNYYLRTELFICAYKLQMMCSIGFSGHVVTSTNDVILFTCLTRPRSFSYNPIQFTRNILGVIDLIQLTLIVCLVFLILV